jgi:hypothetical protein
MQGERLGEIQRALRDDGLDAWLFYDFRGSDPLGRRILGVRSELNVFVDASDVSVTGTPIQNAVVAILGDAVGRAP